MADPTVYDDKNVFARILRKEIPADVVFEDSRCLAFRDLAPQAPQHILVIPKEPIPMVSAARPEHAEILGHLLVTAGEIARNLGFVDDGFRLVVNNGAGAQQTVFHLHVHILAGREFRWPPG